MESESGFIWALIQSFSLANKALFKKKDFGTDFPVNHTNNDANYNLYRLSLIQMWSIGNGQSVPRVEKQLYAAKRRVDEQQDEIYELYV